MNIQVNGKNITAKPGRLYDAIKAAGIAMRAPCGGNGRCGKCLVHIESAPEPSAAEISLLSREQLAQGWRLACHTDAAAGMRITLEEQGQMKISVDGGVVSARHAPMVHAADITLAPPTLADQRSDAQRVIDAVGLPLECEQAALKKLPALLRAQEYRLRVIHDGTTLLDVAAPGSPVMGMAVDIGTTTLAAYLIDLTSGDILASHAVLNPQKPLGDDVITRSDHARQGELPRLQLLVCQALADMATQMCRQCGASEQSIYEVMVAGNTVMMHLLLGVTPEHIAQAPFTPAFTAPVQVRASHLGIEVNPAARLETLPCIAGYVGADTVAAMLACGMHNTDKKVLLIDIGTNGEIALAAGNRIYTCSTAAGPAFEGAHITCGLGSVPGAINKAWVQDGAVAYSTIDDAPATGICGSGLLDIAALLLRDGAVDMTGALDAQSASPALCAHMQEDSFFVERKSNIRLTQKDIRELQLAKGAIAAGIEVLLNVAGVAVNDIDCLYLAGGFGTYMDKASAAQIGLIPQALLQKTQAVGNAAGAGARLALTNADMRLAAVELAGRCQYIELSARQDFQNAFMEKMLFE